MSIPGPAMMMTQQRYQIDSNAMGVASMMNGLRINARQFKAWLDTFTDPVLLAAPYSYTTDELYALRRFAELADAYGQIQAAGGTMTPEDAATMVEIGTRYAGMTFVPARGPAM